jgi:hypothetical protein
VQCPFLRIAFLVLALAAPLGAQGAATTNFSDQWWVPTESGWGASILQQRDVLFIDLFVYDAAGRPTWFTAAANLQPSPGGGRVLFIGDLYMTTGPWFGAFFDPGAVITRRVGSLTFDANSSDTATLLYSVDGVNVQKSITRQLWAYEDFTGSYYGGLVYDLSQCSNPASNGHVEELGPVIITQAGNTAFAMQTQSSIGTCNWNGTYSQLGHMGTVNGTFSCNNGIQGTFTAFELEKTISGMTGRIVATDNFCQLDGHLGGVLR